LSEADLRDRCLILLMSSTGIRDGAIKKLKIKRLKRLQENTNNIGILSMYPQSKNYRYKYGYINIWMYGYIRRIFWVQEKIAWKDSRGIIYYTW
jgi:hypothetical protein